jgi:hypothetical protein
VFPISNIFHGYFQTDAFRKIQEFFELGKAEVSFMSKSHEILCQQFSKRSMNNEVLGAHIFAIFLPEKSDFNLHKRLLAKRMAKISQI